MCVWCCFLSKGKIVRVLDVCLCLWVIWVAGSSLHYSWLEALTHAEEDSAGIQVYVIILKEYKDVLYRKLFSLILAETCVFCSQKKKCTLLPCSAHGILYMDTPISVAHSRVVKGANPCISHIFTMFFTHNSFGCREPSQTSQVYLILRWETGMRCLT